MDSPALLMTVVVNLLYIDFLNLTHYIRICTSELIQIDSYIYIYSIYTKILLNSMSYLMKNSTNFSIHIYITAYPVRALPLFWHV